MVSTAGVTHKAMSPLRLGAGEGNRTPVSCLEGRCSAIELHRQIAIDAPNGRKGGRSPPEPPRRFFTLPGHDPAVRGWNLAEGKRSDQPYLDG